MRDSPVMRRWDIYDASTDYHGPFLPQLTDDEAMRAARLVPREVALLLLEAFSEMVFVHGRVHADPHPGNLLVRPLTETKQGEPRRSACGGAARWHGSCACSWSENRHFLRNAGALEQLTALLEH